MTHGTNDRNRMNRLPGYDRPTRRGEIAVFLSLATAGLIGIMLAVEDSAGYAAKADAVVTALTHPGSRFAWEESASDCTLATTNATTCPAGAGDDEGHAAATTTPRG